MIYFASFSLFHFLPPLTPHPPPRRSSSRSVCGQTGRAPRPDSACVSAACSVLMLTKGASEYHLLTLQARALMQTDDVFRVGPTCDPVQDRARETKRLDEESCRWVLDLKPLLHLCSRNCFEFGLKSICHWITAVVKIHFLKSSPRKHNPAFKTLKWWGGGC